MIFDANVAGPPSGAPYHVCVIGAGPAGISLSLRLAEQGKRVLLLEAGDRDFTGDSQRFYEGKILGYDYGPPDAVRLRYLGGTSGHWGGQCIRMDDFDFERRKDVPLSGWPISYSDLAPFEDAACEVMNIARFGEGRAPGYDGKIDVVEQRWSSQREFYEVTGDVDILRFSEFYFDHLSQSENIDVVLNANVTALGLDGATGRIASATYRSYSGDVQEVLADQFVLAMGALENARFLLLMNERHENRLGNQGDMVGRCFMEHPIKHHGAYFITRRLFSLSKYWEFERLIRAQVPEQTLSPRPEHMRETGTLNALLHLRRLSRRPLRDREIGGSEVIGALKYDEDYFFVGETYCISEQAPNPLSRVVLVQDRDDFGLRKLGLDWRLSEIDARTLREGTLEAARMLIRTGLGRMQVDPEIWDTESEITYDYSFHHMGGARMSETPETGVVDANCRVHGIGNLYVAGSGAFATSGAANPTFTIVQLALRLADHLASTG
ncbi:MAG: GMC family oxidoreductase [Rhodobacteraceae bacterium]|nr:GMC family oxidoreductase [Paracoccaceae bacterium]